MKHKIRAEELLCVNCKSYKPLELYPSLYHDKDRVTKEEIELVEKRRHLERKNVSKKDSKYNEKHKEWYLINSDWLKDWKSFVHNKRSSTAYGTRKSDKKGLGILDPGPISNYQLFDQDK